MQTQLLAIDLLPDFALLAALVILGHWVWLFGLKNKNISQLGFAFPKKGAGRVSTSRKDFNPPIEGGIASSAIQELYTATSTQDLPITAEAPVPQEEDFPSPESLLINQWAGVDMVPLLEALQAGSLSPEKHKELQELAFLTLSTQEQYPDPIALA